MGEGNLGLEHPFIKPHLQPVLPQPLRQWAHHPLVLRAVAQEGVVLKILLHNPSALALTLGSIMRGSGWNVTRNRRGLTAKTRSHEGAGTVRRYAARRSIDRKSTRLNSSHRCI